MGRTILLKDSAISGEKRLSLTLCKCQLWGQELDRRHFSPHRTKFWHIISQEGEFWFISWNDGGKNGINLPQHCKKNPMVKSSDPLSWGVGGWGISCCCLTCKHQRLRGERISLISSFCDLPSQNDCHLSRCEDHSAGETHSSACLCRCVRVFAVESANANNIRLSQSAFGFIWQPPHPPPTQWLGEQMPAVPSKLLFWQL